MNTIYPISIQAYRFHCEAALYQIKEIDAPNFTKIVVSVDCGKNKFYNTNFLYMVNLLMPVHIFKNPELYSKSNALQYNFAMKMLSKISFNSNSRILDIGCGDGVITNEIATIVSEGCVIGTDISDAMIEHAAKVYNGQRNVRFIQMDATQNIFRHQFDIITSFNCLHWVSDQRSAILGIAKAATDGAQIALLLSHRKSLYHLVLDKVCASDKWAFFFKDYISPRSFFDVANYESLLVESGLKVINIEEEEMTYYYQTPNDLKEFFSAAGSQIKLIPDDLKENFLNDFVNEFLNQVSLNDFDEIPVSFWCLQVVASKPYPTNKKSQEIYDLDVALKQGAHL
ncbi:trans-aconitate 2-methyltransferase [Legionella lytica]|uniref:Trans-aconitate 2-methyltransferase n=1 Tax=Legionella lytica TaxID=96232 RepID=A0ABW8DB74_9GAMM